MEWQSTSSPTSIGEHKPHNPKDPALLTQDYSEEQQPLENFFRAKGIKTKNEMADDVRTSHLYPPDGANAFDSQEQFLQPHSKTTTLHLVTMEVSRIAVAPTRMTRVLMRISKPSLNLKLEKNLIPIMTVAPATAMLRWKMQTATQGTMRTDRRRNKRPRTEWLRQPPPKRGPGSAEGLKGGERTEHYPNASKILRCFHALHARLILPVDNAISALATNWLREMELHPTFLIGTWYRLKHRGMTGWKLKGALKKAVACQDGPMAVSRESRAARGKLKKKKSGN